MSVICEEVFDETSHPSDAEVKDYAIKIGIDPDSEPHLLPLATEGLMKALPPGWKPCYDENSKSYYYYNHLTRKTQWEHPLDDIYRNLVKKVRTESQSLSLNEPTEDATYAKDDLLSLDEEILPPKRLDPLPLVPFGSSLAPKPRRKEFRILSPLKISPGASPKKETRLVKQRSEDINLGSIRAIHKFGSLDEDHKDGGLFDKHPRALEKLELKVTGGGSMFLKSHTKKVVDSLVSPGTKTDSLDIPRSILRDRSIDNSKSVELDKSCLNIIDKSEKDDEDKKSVRFNLDNNTTDLAATFSDKSSDDDSFNISDRPKADEIINVKVTPTKNRFTVSPVPDSAAPPLKLIKPSPTDFVMPKLTLSKTSDSDEDTKSLEKIELRNMDQFFEDSDESPDKNIGLCFEYRANKKLDVLKQKLWEEKNAELVAFKENLDKSHKHELERILGEEKLAHLEKVQSQVNNLKSELSLKDIEDEKSFENRRKQTKFEIEEKLKHDEKEIREQFETKKEEIEKYYEEKLAEIEKELAEKVEKNKEEIIVTHTANLDQLKQNHYLLIEKIKGEFKVEEQILRQSHLAQMGELRLTIQNDLKDQGPKCVIEEKQYEKLKCEKRLLEDKYRCLKEKYLRLKTEVKLSIEKRNKKKEHNSTNTTNTTGSETELSHSNNRDKDRTPLNSPSRKLLDKPPTPGQSKLESKMTKQAIIPDLDTSVSDNCYQSDEHGNKNDSSDGNNPGRSRKKVFSRLKSSSATRTNASPKSRRSQQRSCSPVENLRRQLQKLEDLEDQFPQNSQSDTYHLRYPFSDGQKFEGSSELEFFRHRIHLEKDSIKRAKESLRTQKALFQQRQNELKLKHGSMARHTLQQLCQEEKELTDMEVSLHRTRGLLGEKVIRLRHLEQSLHRANAKSGQPQDDSTLSDLSSHSASSGFSSTEFIPADAGVSTNYTKALMTGDLFQEPSEIIQSLENLNLEIRDIWDVLRNQQQQSSICIPPFVYPDLGWPVLAGAANMPAPPSIPTLADRLHNYRQHVALANAQSTVVTHASQGATTTLVERTKNLRHWLRQTGTEMTTEMNNPQTNL